MFLVVLRIAEGTEVENGMESGYCTDVVLHSLKITTKSVPQANTGYLKRSQPPVAL